MNDQVTQTPSNPDVSQTSSTTPATLLAANSPDARTATGELKDQSASQTITTPQDGSTTEKGGTEPKATAPDAYAAFKVPDGYKLDTKLIEQVTPLFKEAGLSQEQAQKLVDTYSAQQIALHKQIDQTVTDMRADWRQQVDKDPELGPKLEAVKADIGKALTIISKGDQTFVDGWKKAMNDTGAGDNPFVIKAWHRLAQGFLEGAHVTGSGPSPHGQVPNGKVERPSAARSMYPNLN